MRGRGGVVVRGSNTISIHFSPSSSKLGRQSCWVACLLLCVSGGEQNNGLLQNSFPAMNNTHQSHWTLSFQKFPSKIHKLYIFFQLSTYSQIFHPLLTTGLLPLIALSVFNYKYVPIKHTFFVTKKCSATFAFSGLVFPRSQSFFLNFLGSHTQENTAVTCRWA